MEKIKIKRPPNAFILFSNNHRASVAISYPDISNRSRSKVLGCMWKQMDTEQKNTYFQRQDLAKREHEKLYPNYVYDPNEARVQKSLKMQGNQVELLSKKKKLQKQLVQHTPMQHEGGMLQKIQPKVTDHKQIKKGKTQKGGKAPKRVKMDAAAESTYQISSAVMSASSQSQQIPYVMNVSNNVPHQPTKATSAGVSGVTLNEISTPPMALTKPGLIPPKFKFSPLSAAIFLQNTYKLSCPSYAEPCKLIPLTEKRGIEPIDNRVYSSITVVLSPNKR